MLLLSCYRDLCTCSCSSGSLCDVNQAEKGKCPQKVCSFFACGAVSVKTLLFWHWYQVHHQYRMFSLHKNCLTSSATTAQMSSFKSRFFFSSSFFFSQPCVCVRVCVCVCVCVCLFSVQCESTCTWIDLPFSVKHWLNLFSNVHINMCYTGKCDFTSFKCLATGGKTTHIGVQSMNNWYKVPSLC